MRAQEPPPSSSRDFSLGSPAGHGFQHGLCTALYKMLFLGQFVQKLVQSIFMALCQRVEVYHLIGEEVEAQRKK